MKSNSCRSLHGSIGETPRGRPVTSRSSHFAAGANLAHLVFPSTSHVWKEHKSSPGLQEGNPPYDSSGEVFGAKSPLIFHLSETFKVVGVGKVVQEESPLCMAGIQGAPARLLPAIVFI